MSYVHQIFRGDPQGSGAFRQDMQQVKRTAVSYRGNVSGAPAKQKERTITSSFASAGSREIVQSVTVNNSTLLVSQGFRGEAATSYVVGMPDIEVDNCRVRAGFTPGTWLVTVRGRRESVKKTAPLFDKEVTDTISSFDLLFKSRQEAEEFVASLRKK